MDKELLRVVIIATGLLVIIGMLIWHFIKNRNFAETSGFFSEQEYSGDINDTLAAQADHDDYEVVPLKQTIESDTEGSLQDNFDDDFGLEDDNIEPTPRFTAPEIIQFRIIAKHDEGFNGLELLRAFQIAELEYGSLKIYERIDADRMVDFGVACMAGDGTFPPQNEMAGFFCSGLVLFMQPGVLDDAQKIFDDFLEAVNLIAVELDGDILDHENKPLTVNTIHLLRQSL